MTRTWLRKEALERVVLFEIRRQFGSKNVTGVSVEYASTGAGDANWQISLINRDASVDTTMDSVNDVYAIKAVQAKLQRTFALERRQFDRTNRGG